MKYDIWNRPPQRTLLPSPFCPQCPARRVCREQFTELGCHPEGPPRPGLLHPLAPDWLARINELNGFDLDYEARPHDVPGLPPYIPAVRPTGWAFGSEVANALAIPLSHVERLARAVRRSGKTAKEILGLAESDLLVVLGFASDNFLERHWPGSSRSKLLHSIRRLEPDLAVAWNYSVWHKHSQGWLNPRVEHFYSLSRSMKIFAQMQDLGIVAIPHVYWGLPEDLDRWADWLSKNQSVRTIAIDLQTVDGVTAWQSALRALEYLRDLLPSPVHLMASGVSHLERASQLRHVWPECSLSNMSAYFTAGFLRCTERFGLSRAWGSNPDEWSRRKIFSDVVRQYSDSRSQDYSDVAVLYLSKSNARSRRRSSDLARQPHEIPAPFGDRVPVQLRLWDDAESIA